MPLDLYQLKAFFAVAQTLNYTEASKRLYLTQPAVSHAVAKLSRGLKEELFKKTGNKLSLTETGKILYKTCETVFYELEKAEERIAAVRTKNTGTIRLGATVEFGTTLLVKYLKDFIAKNPGVHIDFQFRHELLKPLMNDELDIIIDCMSHKAEGVEKTPLFREEYAVIASAEFIKKNHIKTPADLSACNVLSLDKGGQWWGNFLNALPAAQRPGLANITEINHIRGIINAAIEAIGIGFVPRYCVLKELKAGTLVNVFPQLKLLEDNFYVYQKLKRAGLERHRNLVNYLKNIKTTQLERA
jgi:DNA-binding transcriptional LysR family regulator